MNNAEFKSFFEEVARYYKIPLPDMKFYWEDLQDYLLVEVRQACREHRKDDRRGSYFPTVSDIVKRINRDKKTTVFSCCVGGCRADGKYRCGPDNDLKYLCLEHYENARFRHDYQIKIESDAKQIIDYAKQAAISCKEMSLQLSERGNAKEKKMMDDLKLYAKLGGHDDVWMAEKKM